MGLTRDPEYPVEYAQLAGAFKTAADGFTAIAVLNAALQILVASIGLMCRTNNCTLEEAEDYAEEVFGTVLKELRNNWNRESEMTDIKVEAS